MSSPELPITLTPQQAAAGVTLTLTLPTGPAHIRVPPCRHGDVIPAQVGNSTVLLRIQVPGPAQPPRRSSPLGCLVTLGVIGAIVAALVLTDDGDDKTPTAGSPTTPVTTSAFPTTTTPTTAPTTEAPPDPYAKGTCLNGRLPDSTTAQSVSNVEEVPCSASDAHYRVIETIPLTSDLNRCNANPKTQYAFSHRYTINGATVNEYVYCLVGLGSYAR